MKEKLTLSQTFSIGLMLFALFFGAGNVIFPPILGQQAGSNMLLAIAGFVVADIGLSLIAIIAITLCGESLNKLGNLVNNKFSLILSIIIYITIGPLCVIPRTGAVSYEMSLLPLISSNFQHRWIFSILFTAIFFGITYFLALNPSKLVNIIGKIITPILLLLITIITIKAIISPIGYVSNPIGDYNNIPFFKGFLSGYQALDALGALVIAPMTINAIKQHNIKNRKNISKYILLCGIIASIGLLSVYLSLGYIGSTSSSLGMSKDGGQLLSNVMNHLFGNIGILLLGSVTTFACLTTAIGLVSSVAEYFSKLLNYSYKRLVLLISIISFAISNIGLGSILKLTEPILLITYPVTIILIFLSFIDKKFNSKKTVYIGAITFGLIISILQVLDSFKIIPNETIIILNSIPLYKLGIGWIVPSLLGALLGYITPYKKICNNPEIS